MPYKVPEDPMNITFLRLMPWEEEQGLYGIAYSTRDGRQEDQLIGTEAEAEAEKRRIIRVARRLARTSRRF